MSSYYNKTDIDNKYPFRLGKDSSGNYGYYKDGADTVTPFKNQADIDSAYNNGYKAGKNDAAPKYTSGDKIGDWTVYAANSNTIILFPLKDQIIDSWGIAYDYCKKFKSSPISGWTVSSSGMPSILNWQHITSLTSLSFNDLTSSGFWLIDINNSYSHSSRAFVSSNPGNGNGISFDGEDGLIHNHRGARPIITLVKS